MQQRPQLTGEKYILYVLFFPQFPVPPSEQPAPTFESLATCQNLAAYATMVYAVDTALIPFLPQVDCFPSSCTYRNKKT